MMSDQRRSGGYRQGEAISHEEMLEKFRSSPPGTFRILPGFNSLGVVDLKRFLGNLGETGTRMQHAMDHGCYLEVIALRQQIADLWLRMFWVAKNGQGEIFEPDDKRTLGQMIIACEKLGFRPDLIQRLKDFNQTRNDAIHNFLLGATDYAALRTVCDSSLGLETDLQTYVGGEAGQPIQNMA